MRRSYRGLGLVVLMLLVVAPLTLFGVLSLFEDESADSIDLSLDGVHWTQGLQGTLLASPEPWEPGESRSAIVYVRNGGPDPVDADGRRALPADRRRRDRGRPHRSRPRSTTTLRWSCPVYGEPDDVLIDELGSDQVVPLTLTATLADTAPIGATLDGQAVRLELAVTGTRTQESGTPSLLDATGAQLWLAPILLVAAAVVALLVQARRSARSSGARRHPVLTSRAGPYDRPVSTPPRIGVLALQGDVREHLQVLARLGVEAVGRPPARRARRRRRAGAARRRVDDDGQPGPHLRPARPAARPGRRPGSRCSAPVPG